MQMTDCVGAKLGALESTVEARFEHIGLEWGVAPSSILRLRRDV